MKTSRNIRKGFASTPCLKARACAHGPQSRLFGGLCESCSGWHRKFANVVVGPVSLSENSQGQTCAAKLNAFLEVVA